MDGLVICQTSEGKKIYHFYPVPKWQVGECRGLWYSTGD